MKFKICVYSATREPNQTEPIELGIREAAAPDKDAAKQKGREIAVAAFGGTVKAASWAVVPATERPVLIVYLRRSPPPRARLPRGWRFNRPA